MNNRVSVRKCEEYDLSEISAKISEIYLSAGGPDPSGKRVLLKPNVLSDREPDHAVCTHPVFVEAAILFFRSAGAAEIMVGDSPAVHRSGFDPVRSGIRDVCNRTGTEWVNFLNGSRSIKLRKGNIRVSTAVLDADLIISMPKLKTHELMYLTCAIKNTLGIVPGFTKATQHALHSDRRKFGSFLVDLNEAVTPDFFLTDGIMAMEGPGPGKGLPVKMNVMLGSTNPLALDIIATRLTGYAVNDITTNKVALERRLWLSSPEEIQYEGPEIETLIKADFKRVHIVHDGNLAVRFLIRRVRLLRRLERRPVFNSTKCISCKACIKICPPQVLSLHPTKKNRIIIRDSKCIRCFCCAEVCPADAIDVRKKIF